MNERVKTFETGATRTAPYRWREFQRNNQMLILTTRDMTEGPDRLLQGVVCSKASRRGNQWVGGLGRQVSRQVNRRTGCISTRQSTARVCTHARTHARTHIHTHTHTRTHTHTTHTHTTHTPHTHHPHTHTGRTLSCPVVKGDLAPWPQRQSVSVLAARVAQH